RLANTVSGYADKFVQKFGLNLQSTLLLKLLILFIFFTAVLFHALTRVIQLNTYFGIKKVAIANTQQ
ncbi:hypothetical protein P4G59_15695, partial [Lactiplantibacillus plantarum]|uniref:hypothetical protein n=1 Tax=Lactiplantibacillus plantarum TaxID=1590 RepID=UPI00273950E1